MLTKEQLKIRRSGLGGSDISAALGLSPWKTQLQLWAEKTGAAEPQEQSAAMEWGHRLESAIFCKFEESHPSFTCSHAGGTVRHPDIPYLLATPDGYITDNGELGILEIKTSGQQVWEMVPEYYILQAQHYMYVMKKSFAYFAVLFRGTEYREYGPIKYNPDYERDVLPRLVEFWQAVEDNAPLFRPASMQDVAIMFGMTDEHITVDTEITRLLQQYKGFKEVYDGAKQCLDGVRTSIAEYMEGASKVVNAEGKTLVSQSQVSDSIVVDSKRLKEEEPELFEKYSKVRKGYRTLRVYA